MKRNGKAHHLALVLACILALFASGESISRQLFPAVPSRRPTLIERDEALGWRLRPGASDRNGCVDADGLWRPTGQASSSDGPRVLCVGDSVTFGYHLPADQAWPWLLCERLNARCLNAGTPGYDTEQEAAWLRIHGMALRPDVVILGFCFNDVGQPRALQSPSNPPRFSLGMARAAYAGLTSIGLLDRPESRGQTQQQIGLEQLEILPEPPAVSSAWQSVAIAVADIAEQCRRENVPLLVVVFPIRGQTTRDLAPRRIVDICDDLGVARLSLRVVVTDEMFLDSLHLTARGHAAAADAIARYAGPEAEASKTVVRGVCAGMRVTTYCPCSKCCGPNANGITASGHHVGENGGRMCAADSSIPFGTLIAIPTYNGGKPVPVWDRGGSINGDRLDVLFATHAEAQRWGVQTFNVAIFRQVPTELPP